MNKKIKLILFFIAIFGALLIIPNFSNAATTVHDETSLNDAVSSADSGATITLQNDITVTKPIVIAKELTIDGNGHNVVGDNSWTSTSGNQTMFTAQLSDAKLTLKNIKLKNGPKYGVQSYDGATVILDNVSISGFKYGGVLANGGKVEVKSLHLGYNGTTANNGIEIDKGSAATNNPTLVMNGTLTSTTNENVVRVAENGSLKSFTITNTANTTNKVVLSGGKVVLTDANDNVISETTVPGSVTANADQQKTIVTIVVNDKTNKITVDVGKTITEDLLKSHIDLDKNYKIDGYYTDTNFTNKFDFSKAVNSDTTIYVKTSKVENTTQANNNKEKDVTPKTGIENYIGVAILTIAISIGAIAIIRKKEIK